VWVRFPPPAPTFARFQRATARLAKRLEGDGDVETFLALILSPLALPSATPTGFPDGAQFDVVSITLNVTPPGSGGGMRTLPHGSFTMTNEPMASILNAASPSRSSR
jgi:hypothetical protein